MWERTRDRPEMMQVLIVHHSTFMGSLLAAVLSRQADVEVADWITTLEESLTVVDSSRYDVILAGATLPDSGSLKLIKAIAGKNRFPKIVVVCVPQLKQLILQYIMAGAAGYVTQDVSVEGLLASVRAVAKNEALVSPDMAAALIAQTQQLARQLQRQEAELATYQQLTLREQEVLMLIGAGCTNAEIARRLWLAEGTVKNHVHKVFQKLGVKDRKRAATFFWHLFHQPSS